MSNSGGVVQGSGRKGAGSGLPRRFFVRGAQEKEQEAAFEARLKAGLADADAQVQALKVAVRNLNGALEGAEAKLAEAGKEQVRYFSPWSGFVVGRDGIRPLEWLVGQQMRGVRLAVSGAQCAALWQKAACWEPGRGESFFARTFKRMMVWRDLDALFIEETGAAIGLDVADSLRSLTLETDEEKMVAGVYLGLVGKGGTHKGRPYWIFVGDGQ
jgi:hypothetical protein